MGFSLPYPNVPTNGQTLDATPLLANIVALAQAIASFDGSQIQAGSILPASFNANINPNTLLKETTVPFVASGLVWSAISGLAAGMTSGVLYYNGIRTPVTSVSSETFTASKDTYVDIDVNGNVTYNAVSNNASAPSLTANATRVAKVVTSGSAVSSITQTGVDSNNVAIYPISPYGLNSWVSWTPSFSNLTIGNGVINGRYTQIGKSVFVNLLVTLGSTSSVGSTVTFTLPVTASTNYIYSSANGTTFTTAYYLQPSVQSFTGLIRMNTNTTAQFIVSGVSGGFLNTTGVTSGVPFTWATGNQFMATFFYEAA